MMRCRHTSSAGRLRQVVASDGVDGGCSAVAWAVVLAAWTGLIECPGKGTARKGPYMPPAVLAWLDYSEADQRRAREIVALFSQRESRDELGLGRIRDALSDTLFPGTSVLLTRARYLLFVPWLFREGARRGSRGPQLASWVDGQERRLIGALREGGDLGGLIGSSPAPPAANGRIGAVHSVVPARRPVAGEARQRRGSATLHFCKFGATSATGLTPVRPPHIATAPPTCTLAATMAKDTESPPARFPSLQVWLSARRPPWRRARTRRVIASGEIGPIGRSAGRRWCSRMERRGSERT